MNGYFVIKTIPEAISYLPKKEQQEAAWAVMLYGSTGELPQDLSPAVQAILTFICPAIDNANKQAMAKRENGKKGGRPRKEENLDKTEEEDDENLEETEEKPSNNLGETEKKPSDNLDNNLEETKQSLPPVPPIYVSSFKFQDSSIKIQETRYKNESAPAREDSRFDDCLIQIPSVEAVTEIAENLGVKQHEAKLFYEYYSSQGWKFSNGRAVEDIPSALMRWNSRANQFAEKRSDGKRFERERVYEKKDYAFINDNADNFDDF